MMVSDQPKLEDHDSKPWKKVHPASVLINLIPQLIRILRGLWLIILFVFFTEDQQNLFDMSFFFVLLSLGVYRTVIHVLTLRYRIVDQFVEIKVGLFYKQQRRIDMARIQNIEIKQNPLHKIFQLAEIQIETAGSSEEGLLSALDMKEAEFLRNTIIEKRALPEENEELEQITHLSTFYLLLYGLTSNQIGTVVVLSALGSEALSVMNPRTAQEIASQISVYNALGIILLSFGLSWLWSCFQSILLHHNFTLFRTEKSLQSSEGLITKRRVEIPCNKVQLAILIEPWLRRLVGYGTLHIETAAFGIDDGHLRKTETVVPMLEKEQFSPFLAKTIPQLDVDPWNCTLLPPHPKALYRGIVRGLLQSMIPIAILIFVFRDQSYAAMLALLALVSIPFSILDWKGQGWLITKNSIVSRRGYLNRKTWIIDRHKLQSIHVYQSPFMRIHNLAHLVVYVAGSEIILPDVDMLIAHEAYENLNTQWNLQQEENLLLRDDAVPFDDTLLDTEIIE